MSNLSLQQIRGLKDLVQEGVEVGVNRIEEAQQAITRWPYAVLEQIPLVNVPSKAVERVQHSITSGVYTAIRGINRVGGAAATRVLVQLEQWDPTKPR